MRQFVVTILEKNFSNNTMPIWPRGENVDDRGRTGALILLRKDLLPSGQWNYCKNPDRTYKPFGAN
jgi:hypothetical protein